MNLPMAPTQEIPAAQPLPMLSDEEIAALQSEVRELAAAKDAVILAHNY
jgi:quinolinate synthase